MERSELVALLSPEGLRLLDSLPPYSTEQDVLRIVSRPSQAGPLPRASSPPCSPSPSSGGRRRRKFGEFASSMLFTEAGLEQATRLPVAARHAGRFRAAGIRRVADLGCGIGGDALALAALDLEVTAVDADEVTAAIASFNLAPFPTATVEQRRAEDVDLRSDRRRLPRPRPADGRTRADRAAGRSRRLHARRSASPTSSATGRSVGPQARPRLRPRPHPLDGGGPVDLGRRPGGRARALVRRTRPPGHPPRRARAARRPGGRTDRRRRTARTRRPEPSASTSTSRTARSSAPA